MSRIAYVNGAYAPLSVPLVSVLDRGFQLADAIYEVWAVRGGRLFDAEAHMARLWRSRPLSHALLHGVTRAALLKIARERQMRFDETPFTVAEAKAAPEAFMSSASNPATGIVSIDGAPVGDGKVGPVTRALRAVYLGA